MAPTVKPAAPSDYKKASSTLKPKSTKQVDVVVAKKPSVDNKRKSRHHYDRVTHGVFTPFFTGLEAHLAHVLCDGNAVTPENIHKAIISYDVKSYFQKQFEGKGRRVNKKARNGGKRPLSTFMLFQEDMRPKVSQKLEKELGRKPSQPEVVCHLGKLWNSMKQQPNGIDHYVQLYEANKRKAEAVQVDE
jgi:hypothetical protein